MNAAQIQIEPSKPSSVKIIKKVYRALEKLPKAIREAAKGPGSLQECISSKPCYGSGTALIFKYLV